MSEDTSNMREFENRLDHLFAEYRSQNPDLEPSVNFMPHLWARIESSQNYTLSLRHWVQAFVTAAVAICMIMALYLVAPDRTPAVYTASYLDALTTADPGAEQPAAYVDVLHHANLDSNLQ